MYPEVARRIDDDGVPGSWLKAAQAAAGDTPSAVLARRLSVESTTIYRWREDKPSMSRVAWIACLHALGLPYEWSPEHDRSPEHEQSPQAETPPTPASRKKPA